METINYAPCPPCAFCWNQTRSQNHRISKWRAGERWGCCDCSRCLLVELRRETAREERKCNSGHRDDCFSLISQQFFLTPFSLNDAAFLFFIKKKKTLFTEEQRLIGLVYSNKKRPTLYSYSGMVFVLQGFNPALC